MPKPEKPVKPVKTRQTIGDADDSDTTVTSSSRTKTARKITTIERTLKSQALSKREPSSEERSALRKQRRQREAAEKMEKEKDEVRKEKSLDKKGKRRKVEPPSEESEDDDAEVAPAAGVAGANLNLSNSNNITINNTGMEDMARLFTKMLDEMKESKTTKDDSPVKASSSKVEKTTVVETTVRKETILKIDDLSERLDCKHIDLPDLQEKYAHNTRNSTQQLNPRSKFKPGLAQTTTISKTTLKRWIEEEYNDLGSFAWLFWAVVYMWPSELHFILAALTMWCRGHVTELEFAALIPEALKSIREHPDHPGSQDNEALEWFLMEYKQCSEIFLITKHCLWPEYEAADRLYGGSYPDIYVTDTFHLADLNNIGMLVAMMKKERNVPLTAREKIEARRQGWFD